MTAADLISNTLEDIGALGQGETAPAADLATGLVRLNAMIESWQVERLMINAQFILDGDLVANQQDYTLGTSLAADITCPVRPVFLDHAATLCGTGASAYEVPIELLSDAQWAAIAMKSITSTFPTKANYTLTLPDGTISLWPIPTDATNHLRLYVPLAAARIPAISTALVMVPAAEEALRYNLGVRLCPPFGRKLDPVIAGLAGETKAALKRVNAQPDLLRCDAALTGGKPFDLWTGGL